MSQVIKKEAKQLLEGKSTKAKSSTGSSKTPQKKNQPWFKNQKKTYNKSSSGGSGNFGSGTSGSQSKGTKRKFIYFIKNNFYLGSNYCPIHGPASTHPWDKCHLNKEGSNFNPDKAVAWASNLKKKSDS